MNLKNNYLLKKLLKWTNIKCKNFNTYNVVFFKKKKIKKNTWRYHYFTLCSKNLDDMIYRVWQTEIGNCGSFFTLLLPSLKTQIIKILKKWQNLLEISSFYTCVPKTTIIWGTVPKIRSETFFVILNHFLPFQEGYIKILKKWKKHLEMSSFYTCVPKITIIYKVCFLRYEVRQTCFVI